MSNEDMIWFFFVCFKKLIFYGTEQMKINEIKSNTGKRKNCHILKFSNGGNILVAGNLDNIIFIINTYSR